MGGVLHAASAHFQRFLSALSPYCKLLLCHMAHISHTIESSAPSAPGSTQSWCDGGSSQSRCTNGLFGALVHQFSIHFLVSGPRIPQPGHRRRLGGVFSLSSVVWVWCRASSPRLQDGIDSRRLHLYLQCRESDTLLVGLETHVAAKLRQTSEAPPALLPGVKKNHLT